ncbi:MAG: hypothetical protein ABR515_08535, partial [Nitrososphaeraceae archaeon]
MTVAIYTPVTYADKRECKDSTKEVKYNSEDHDDNIESEKAFKKSLKQDSLCEFTEKHDKEELKGEVKIGRNTRRQRYIKALPRNKKTAKKKASNLLMKEVKPCRDMK